MVTMSSREAATLGIRRCFSTAGVHPYDTVAWERCQAKITNWRDGSVSFFQDDVEVPSTWSQNATNILAQKYFRGAMGTPERETSLRQVTDRVVDTITRWGVEGGYFATLEEAEVFSDELKWLIIHQRAAFNSPVWFNIGVAGVPQQAAACFILDVEDTMNSILNWYREEGMIFKGGSGAGANLSKIRSAKEPLAGGGTASGPVSFMRGADASAGTIKSGGKTRRAAKMVILDVDHPDIAEFIWCKAREEHKARALRAAGFDMDLDGADSYSLQYQNANNSVRLSDRFMEAVVEDRPFGLVARTTGEVIEEVSARDLFRQIAQAAWECADPGVQFDDTINAWNTTPTSGRIEASNPCSEHMRLANSACNLASLNLLAFIDDEGTFDVEGFSSAVDVVFLAQEILVGASDYPTEKIGETARRFRDLGIGYANLGASLMALGLAYDSDAGRAWAAAVTALLTGRAYRMSAKVAERMGPFAAFSENRTGVLAVLEAHRAALEKLPADLAPAEVLSAAEECWDEAIAGAEAHGIRNAEASVLAPTGTIGFLMDCDTTGIEPDLGLVKTKKLVGGGTMSIVNQTLTRALRRLGYDAERQEAISAWVAEHGSVLGAPGMDPQHYPVFACSMGDNVIEPMGHVRMMAAVQPFISGAISKTVNMPASATVEDIESLYLESWRLGLKAVAVYRDGCKVAQPLEAKSSATASGEEDSETKAKLADLERRLAEQTVAVKRPVRERLPRHRRSRTYAFSVADCEGYVTVGEYDDGRPGEVFMKVSKQGSTLAGVMDAFSIAISLGLQHGVPLATFVRKYTNMRFEPAGITDDPELRIATSLVDYIFRRLAVDYLSPAERAELGVLTSAERIQPTLPGVDDLGMTGPAGGPTERSFASQSETTAHPAPAAGPAEVRGTDAPYCYSCGNVMVRAGSCHVCPACGSTSGCS